MTSHSGPGPAQPGHLARVVIAFLRHSPARHRVTAALVLLTVAAASLIGPADTVRIDALALAAIMTSLLVLADLAAAHPRTSQPDAETGRFRPVIGLAAPARTPRPREPHPSSGSAPACMLCGAPSHSLSVRPVPMAWNQGLSIQDMMLPGAGLHMAANDDGSGDAQDDARSPETDSRDEDRDFWTEEIGPAQQRSLPEHAVPSPPAPIAPALSGYTGSLAKHALDTLTAWVALLALAPLLAAIWITLKLAGGGPALIHARRRDWSDRSFRTTAFGEAGSLPHPASRPLRALVDPYLRRTGLARLPLLLGVAAGHLAFVGPEPGRHCETVAERAGAAIVAELAERLGARPGLAGSARIHAALGDPALPVTHAALVICDLFYLEHATPLLDLRILAAACAISWARPRQ